MVQFSQLPWGIALLGLAGLAAAKPSVNVALKAAFPSPPYLVELLETAAADNATVYFSLLDRIAKGHFAKAKTDKALYEKFVEVLAEDGHMNPEALSMFKLSLSLHTAAPRIEAHYQYYASGVEPLLFGDQTKCAQWLYLDGYQFCSPTAQEPHLKIRRRNQERTLPFDRKLGSGGSELILYADITSPEFGAYHKVAMKLVRNGQASYRLRYKRSPAHPSEPLSVNGYGVELTLKKTDYIVIDDRDTGAAKTPSDDAQKPIGSPEAVLDEEDEITDIKPLEKSDLAPIGLKAASYIMQSESPFDTLIKLSQDFPKLSTSLVSHNVSTAFLEEHEDNRRILVPDGRNVLWMNGVQLIDRQIQPFGLIQLLKQERKLMKGASDLGLTGKQAVDLMGHREVARGRSGNDEDRRFDWRDEIEQGRVIIWLNNLEKDKRYEDFAPSIFAVIEQFESFPRIKKDIFNLVVPVDFTKQEDLQLVSQLLAFIKRLIPVRMGLVPLTPTGEAIEQAKLIYYLLENYGLAAATGYLEQALETKKWERPDEGLFNAAIKDRPLRPESEALAFKDIFTSENYEQQIHLAKHWVERLRAGGEVPTVFFDGFAIPRDPLWLRVMNGKMIQDLQSLQHAAYFGQINDAVWVPGRFLKGALKRRNMHIFPEDGKEPVFLNVNKLYTEHPDILGQAPVIEADEGTAKEDWAVVSVVVDLNTVDGQKLLYFALKFRAENPGVRLDIVSNPLNVYERWPSIPLKRLKANEAKLRDIQRLSDLETIIETPVEAEYDYAYNSGLRGFLADAKLKEGDNAVIINGRLVGPIKKAEDFVTEDFQALFEAEKETRIHPVYSALTDLGLIEKVSSPLAAAKLTSITALSGISDLPQGIFDSAQSIRTSAFRQWQSNHTSFSAGSDPETASIFFVAAINPASELGQKWAAVLKVLSELEGVHVQVFLNPANEVQELPVKRFYRYVLESAPSFDEDGKVRALSANFVGVPQDTLLVAGMDVPPAWLVTSKVSVDDLDNLRIKDIKARRGTDRVEAVYELEHILIEGHSREVPSGAPPRGVQLVLGTDANPLAGDTIIMANLGYFQFKANPGVYTIRLKEGRSQEIFWIESVGAQGWTPVAGDETSEVALMDFQGLTLYPRLTRNPGMEEEDVLEDGSGKEGDGSKSGAAGIMSKGLNFAQKFFGGGGGGEKAEDKPAEPTTEHADINIFSVASGHLYERMLNIMMVSVMKHTNHTVKFWFIEQFLSPSFKDFIPHLAKQYNFTYEMVTYKWPHWLRQQKEKQREIWGYKILFLDVLFPLSLDKVIFVDADQIVRTDMYELVSLDLEGAPYGFTPMCDSRTEMEGFRFWKTGYWANYLKGLPYHISALYVVDLRRFRELAAGDRLRQTYHSLSADPGSLANLDQDLPNHMQFQIPIRSLPQEWLWCETWCSDETLKDAKTIDLCNNPQTKEPKLDRARRQVPEWTVYDEEIAALARKVRDGGKEEERNEKSRTLDVEKESETEAWTEKKEEVTSVKDEL